MASCQDIGIYEIGERDASGISWQSNLLAGIYDLISSVAKPFSPGGITVSR